MSVRSLRLRRSVGLLALLSAALLCWRLALDACAQLDRLSGPVVIHIAGVAADGYGDMLDSEQKVDNPVRFALWTQRDGQWAEAPDTVRSRSLSVIEVQGDTRLLLPCPATLYENDRDGCLIDRHTAQALFGGGDAVGAVVRWQGRDYTVRGVLESPKGTMVVRPDPDNPPMPDRVTVDDGAQASRFAMRHGLSAALTVNSRVYCELARLFSRLPVLALCWLAAAWLGRLRRELRPFPVQAALCTGGMLAAATAGVLLLLGALPSAVVPSRWSDFAFWSGTARDVGGAVLGYLSAALYKPDWVLLGLTARAALGLVGTQCLLMALRYLPAAGRRGKLVLEEE